VGTRADTALAVALIVFVLGLVFGGRPDLEAPRRVDCAFPVEARAEGGRSVEVECSGSAARRPNLRGPARLLFGLPLDLNVAQAASLESLPGIGPRRAAAIVAARCLEPFEDLEAVRRVVGIGSRTVEGLRGWAVAEGTPDCLERAGASRARTPRGAQTEHRPNPS
jgi:hypothetical protein